MLHESALVSWLHTTLLFRDLSRSQLVSLLDITQLQTFSKGDLIFQEGGEATGCFVIKTGRIKVFKMSPTGKEQILNIFEVGENFAEIAALDGKPFPASAAALEFSELLFFPRELFLDLLRQSPDITINMLISLAQHSRHLARVIEDLSFKDVPQRLATYLLNLSEAYVEGSHPPSPPTHVITLDLTKSQLAAILGTVPATLSRAFYRLSSEGLIAVNGPKIELRDRDRLQAFSQSCTQSDG
ncbi:Crp/Fnr family transcriptional regulator [Trichothermofontia sp.]